MMFFLLVTQMVLALSFSNSAAHDINKNHTQKIFAILVQGRNPQVERQIVFSHLNLLTRLFIIPF